MEQKKLTECLAKWYDENHTEKGRRKASGVFVVPLLAELTADQLYQLQNGSGNPLAQIHQVNSSAGLVVNYYKLFEEAHPSVVVDFEWKESIPLLKSSAPANLDVRYELDGTIYFIESKFLEPYYSDAKKNAEAYFDKSRYPKEVDVSDKDAWQTLFKHEGTFRYFDYPQLCRHLLAIYRHNKKNPEMYRDKEIVLRSVGWEMTPSFKQYFQSLGWDDGDMKERCDTIQKEKEIATSIFKEHIQKISWHECRFETDTYNNMLDEISGSKKFNQFIKQYFLES